MASKKSRRLSIPMLMGFIVMVVVGLLAVSLMGKNTENRSSAAFCTAGTKQCNASGGYNYCNGRQWLSYSCAAGYKCTGKGLCTKPSGNCTVRTYHAPQGETLINGQTKCWFFLDGWRNVKCVNGVTYNLGKC
jgi:hypothetical protein